MDSQCRPHILVLTHGYMGKELIKSAEMIVGAISDIHFIPLTIDVTIDEYRENVEKEIRNMPTGSVVLVDMFGGTPCNTAALLSRDTEVHLVAGVNLPVLIDCTQLREEYFGEKLCEELVENAKMSILSVKV